MVQKKSTNANNDSSTTTIKCKALETSGRVGLLYDAHQDHVREQKYLSDVEISSELINRTQCCIKGGSKDKNRTLLQLSGITEELRLSLLVGLVPKTGIAAIIDHPYSVSNDTRILCYTFVHRMEQLSGKVEKSEKHNKLSIPKSNVTHIITGVSYGIDMMIVLQLPSDSDAAKKISDILQRISDSLNYDHNSLALDADEEDLLRKMTNTMVYSNISKLTKETTVFDICLYLAQNKERFTDTPIMYTLQPIKCIVPQYNGLEAPFVSIPSKVIEKVEQYLIDSSNTINRLKDLLDVNVSSLLGGHLEKELRDRRREWQNLKDKYDNIIKQLKQLITDIRSGHSSSSQLNQKFNDGDHKTLNDSIEQFSKRLDILKLKGQWITELQQQQGFEYCNAAERHVSVKDNEKTLVRKLTTNNRQSRILCTNDKLNKKHPTKLTQQRHQLVEERKVNPNLDIVYADFSYCSVEPNTTIIPIPTARKPSPSSTETQSFDTASSSSGNEVINILLLGESGVGKSTFINAFVNYLTSETCEHAQSNEPVVLIPVSFLITTGDNFEERTVKFGDFVSSHNEDFDHVGESVTQHCKLYEFHLNRNDGKKICIIDTPGFGDTRGLDQNDLNMQDILGYINNLTHLNAVCFLLKPNTSKLHTFFRMCFTQLIDLLGPNVRENIIFCFTNARSTFYTPGDTAPLLKALLKSLAIMNDISFKKENTFCFDNEAFRYLVALQNQIQFNDEKKHEYEMSWSTSVNESNRLLNYISTKLGVCPMQSDLKSIKHAQIEIIQMIRPMLEAMRNILRNSILYKTESPNKSIKLCSKAIHRPAAICSLCPPYPKKVGNFWVVNEMTHELIKKCLVCSCATDQHVPITYVLRFEELNTPSSYQQSEMDDMVYRLCLAGAGFDYFLTYVARSSKDDSFGKRLTRMIAEENNLCENQKPNRLNLQLYKDLTAVQCQYEEQIEDSKSKQQQTTLPNIYQWITTIREHPLIQEQLKAIKQTQILMAEPYEVSQV